MLDVAVSLCTATLSHAQSARYPIRPRSDTSYRTVITTRFAVVPTVGILLYHNLGEMELAPFGTSSGIPRYIFHPRWTVERTNKKRLPTHVLTIDISMSTCVKALATKTLRLLSLPLLPVKCIISAQFLQCLRLRF